MIEGDSSSDEWESSSDESESSSNEEESKVENRSLTQIVAGLPGIDKAVNKVKNVYGTVKESNSAVKTVLNVTESTLKVVGTVGGPVVCSAVGCLAAATIPGIGTALNVALNTNQVQPVVGAVCAAAHIGIKKLIRKNQ